MNTQEAQLRVLCLTMNPSVDLATETERVVPTHKLRCGDTLHDAGGGGINVARVLTRPGGRAAAPRAGGGGGPPRGGRAPPGGGGNGPPVPPPGGPPARGGEPRRGPSAA